MLFFTFLCQPVIAGEWVTLDPIHPQTIDGALGDIDCHMPQNHKYRFDDKVTWAHETTHGVNSLLRNKFRIDNGYYLIRNKAFLIGSPKLTLREIANNIPINQRGRIYDLYMVKAQQWWNNTPFYMMDECCAYINGTLVGIEVGMKDRAVYSFDNGLELWRYMKVAQRMSREINFEEQKDLDKFIDRFEKNRINYIKEQFKKKGW